MEATMAHAQDTCQQCGQTDDHPKAHIAEGGEIITKHHDCLSAREETMLRESAQAKDSGPKASAVIDACKDGAKGEKLRALIQGGKLPQAEGLVHKASIEHQQSQEQVDAGMQASLASQAHFTQKEG
jgi:hypothetical protein